MPHDMQMFLRNRKRFAPNELARYRGKFVAWSPDGRCIIASSDKEEELDRLIRDVGESPEDCVVGAVPEADAVIGGTEAT